MPLHFDLSLESIGKITQIILSVILAITTILSFRINKKQREINRMQFDIMVYEKKKMLFERRKLIYNRVYQFIQDVMEPEKNTSEMIMSFSDLCHFDKSLFDERVATFLKELIDKAIALNVVFGKSKRDPDQNHKTQINQEIAGFKTWFLKKYSEIEKIFLPSLTVDVQTGSF